VQAKEKKRRRGKLDKEMGGGDGKEYGGSLGIWENYDGGREMEDC
jgi:hypothetical protein